MPSPSSALATQRPDLAASMEAFDLEAEKQKYTAPACRDQPGQSRTSLNPLTTAANRDTKRALAPDITQQLHLPAGKFATKNTGRKSRSMTGRQRCTANFSMLKRSGRRAMNAVLCNAEKRWAAALFNSTTWTGAGLFTDVATIWATIATATPLANVEAAVQKVYDNSACGRIPVSRSAEHAESSTA
jgi:hypothetical protein